MGKKKSKAYAFVEIARDHNHVSGNDKWRQAIRGVVLDAVHLGLEFAKGDYEYMRRFVDDEWFYTYAIIEKNYSAVKAFENDTGREPFRYNNVETGASHRVKGTTIRKRERLAVGCTFRWKKEKVTVTSFANDHSYLIACSYKEKVIQEDGYCHDPAKIDHRHKITHEDLKGVGTLCEDCGEKGIFRKDYGLDIGTYCDECFDKLVKKSRSENR